MSLKIDSQMFKLGICLGFKKVIYSNSLQWNSVWPCFRSLEVLLIILDTVWALITENVIEV